MSHNKKKFSGSREASRKKPVGAILLAAAVGMVIGSASTYYFSNPAPAPTRSASPSTGTTPQAQASMVTPQPQFTPAPQPPGEPPPGKVWSVEHGHWHDIPSAATTLMPATAPGASATVTPTPASATVTPATTTPTPAPTAVPAEKK